VSPTLPPPLPLSNGKVRCAVGPSAALADNLADDFSGTEESSTVFPHLQLHFGSGGDSSLLSFPSRGDASEWANLSLDLSLNTSRGSGKENDGGGAQQKPQQLQPERRQPSPSPPPREDDAVSLGVATYDFVENDYGDGDYDLDDQAPRQRLQSQSSLRLSGFPVPPLGSIQGELDSQDGPSYLPDRILRGVRRKKKEPLQNTLGKKEQRGGIFRMGNISGGDKKNRHGKSTSAIENANSFGLSSRTSKPSSRVPVHDSEKVVSPPNFSVVTSGIPSPLNIEYTLLLEDPAYRHAQHAGTFSLPFYASTAISAHSPLSRN